MISGGAGCGPAAGSAGTAPDFDLDQFVPYLVNRAGMRIVAAFSRELKPHALDIQKWRLLAALRHADRLTISGLAALTSIEISTVSRLAAGLQRRGLVRRRRQPDDARAVVVALSAEGRALTDRLVPLALRYEAGMLDGMSSGEVATLKRLLRRAFANLARFEPSVPRSE